MAPLLLLLLHLNATECSLFSPLTPTATRCYIAMIAPKHHSLIADSFNIHTPTMFQG